MTTLPEPVEEGIQTLTFTVRVRSYGQADKVQGSVERSLCLALHRAFGVERVDVEVHGNLLIFDPLADDGEHDGHARDGVLLRMPKAETVGERSAVREIPGEVVIRGGKNLDLLVLRLDLATDAFLMPDGAHVLVIPA